MPPPLPPPTAPLPPLPKSSGSQSRRKSMMPDSMVLGGLAKLQEGHIQLPKGARSPSLAHEAHIDARRAQTPPTGPPVRSIPPPAPPSANPWDHKIRVSGDATQLPDRTNVNRRPQVPTAESPVYPSNRGSPEIERRSTPGGSRPTSSAHGHVDTPTQDSDDRRRLPGNHAPTYGIFPAPVTRARAPTVTSTISPMIPENNVAETAPHAQSRDSAPQYPYSPSSYSRHRDSSAISINSDLNLSSNHSQDPRSSATTGYESSRLSSATKSSYRMSQSAGGLEVVVPGTVSEDSCGPIPVDSERDSASTRTGTNRTSMPPAYAAMSRDCTIAGNSSFYLAGGFCEGAREIARGGAGIKKTKKPVVCIFLTPQPDMC
jgi:hypothetical protein